MKTVSKFEDHLSPSDKVEYKLKGHIVIRDALTGEILEEKDNLIVQRGRSYVLEVLTNLKPSVTSGFITNKNRALYLFKIGNGGADIESSPFESIVPKFSDLDLYNPVPFIIVDPNKNGTENESNPSYVTELRPEDKKKYFLPVESIDNTTRYYGKIFDPDTERLYINKSSGETYVHFTLSITPKEARQMVINEIGLVLAEPIYEHPEAETEEEKGAIINFKDPEIFSHVTFDSISLTSTKSGVIFDYYIYA